jgi:hypothetical protein
MNSNDPSASSAGHYTSGISPSTPTPPRFNKNLRDKSKWFLLVAAIFLLAGRPLVALAGSASSILCLRDGTTWSVKNFKWFSLSIITFGASLISWALWLGYEMVDEEKAYDTKFSLYFRAKFIQRVWSVILGMFLFSAFTSKPSTNDSIQKAHFQ